MIQSVLCFLLGIVLAIFFISLFTPYIWRRAIYLGHKAAEAKLPLTLEQIETQQNFLKTQHALECSRYEERLQWLQQKNDAQKITLDLTEKQRLRLEALEAENNNVKRLLEDEKDSLNKILSYQRIAEQKMQDRIFSNKLIRLDMASYAMTTKTLEEKLSLLLQKCDALCANASSAAPLLGQEPLAQTQHSQAIALEEKPLANKKQSPHKKASTGNEVVSLKAARFPEKKSRSSKAKKSTRKTSIAKAAPSKSAAAKASSTKSPAGKISAAKARKGLYIVKDDQTVAHPQEQTAPLEAIAAVKKEELLQLREEIKDLAATFVAKSIKNEEEAATILPFTAHNNNKKESLNNKDSLAYRIRHYLSVKKAKSG